ncbi:MAG: AAA-like domain-containing protein [Pyrinomonadaceae bacterium]
MIIATYTDFREPPSAVNQIDRSLSLQSNSRKWWRKNRDLSPTERFTAYLEDVILKEVDGNVVIFFDEIDVVLEQPFSDDFFTTIRSIYNKRGVNKDWSRLSIVLLGVASASSLIKNQKGTPFNIGEVIKLDDFDREKTKPFHKVLGPCSDRLIDRIFYWTSGQPFLVHKLSATAFSWPKESRTPERIDEEVKCSYLKLKIEQDTHFNYIQSYLLDKSGSVGKTLCIYRNVLKGKEVEDEEQSQSISRLKLAGVVRSRDGKLAPRNRIYRALFNLNWVQEHVPLNQQKISTYGAASMLALTLLFVMGWSWWVTTDAYQIKAITNSAPGLIASSEITTVDEWRRALALSGFADKALELPVEDESWNLANIIGPFASAGRINEAVTSANLIQDLRYRSWVLAVISSELVRAGRFDEARTSASRIDDPRYRSWVLTKMAVEFAKARRVEEASEVAQEALAAASQIGDARGRLWALADAAGSQMGVARSLPRENNMAPTERTRIEKARAEAFNRTGDALTLISEQGTVADRAWVLAMGAWIYETASRAEDSLGVGPGASAPDNQSRAQAVEVWRQVNLIKSDTGVDEGRATATFSETRLSATRIKDHWSRSWALASVARGQVSLAKQVALRTTEKLFEIKLRNASRQTAREALTAAGMIQDPRDRALALAAIRWMVEQDGILPDALNDTGIGNAREQSRALLVVAAVLAKAGWTVEANRAVDEASHNATNIVEDDERSRILSALAGVQASLHKFQPARETADRCARSVDKLHAYSTILREYARRQNPDISILLEAEEIETDGSASERPATSCLSLRFSSSS